MMQQLLKRETAALHEEIEKSLDLGVFLKTKEAYQSLLKKFYGFYLPLEDRISPWENELLKLGLDLRPRLKTQLLTRDLVTYGFSDFESLPLAGTIPDTSTIEEIFGVLYVLEGSTLGGQVISKMKRENGISPENGPTFHNPYGENTMLMWNNFKSSLNALDEEKSAIVVDSAKQTFLCLNSWLS